MNQLSEPTINNEKIFEDVAKSKTYRNAHCDGCKCKINCETCRHGNRGRMLNFKDKVFKRYQFYLRNKNTLHKIKPVKILDADEAKLMQDSYKTSKIFQEVKQQLFDEIPQKRSGLCPFCMISEPTTLDHYFSESEYPEYILFAPNLVPCCSHCNSVKGSRLFEKSSGNSKRTVIHFYYDELPDVQYLKATFFVDNKIPQISFSLEFENETEITDVIEKHFETLHLFERYRGRSNGILSTACEEVKKCLESGLSIEQCIQLLKIKAQSTEKTYGNNYWEACVYRAMSENKEELLKLM